MFDEYRNRIARQGRYMGEQMRNQTRQVTDALWMNSTTVRPVCVHAVLQGLPPPYDYADEFENTIYAHFEKHKNYNVGGNAVDYLLVVQPQVAAEHEELRIGSYVCIPNINDKLEYWLIVYREEDDDLVKFRVMKTNWLLKWVTDGKIHECLGVLRGESADAEGVEDAGYISTVDSKAAIWLPTNISTNSIGVNTRFLISDVGRTPAQAWRVSKINTVLPIGLTKVTLEQDGFNTQTDNAELMVASYYKEAITPTSTKPILDEEELIPIIGTATISYSGTKPTIKVGGSWKSFTATFSTEGVTPKSWSVSDGTNTFSETTGDYTIEYIDNKLRLKVNANYELISTVLTIKVIGTDGSSADVKIEIVG